MPDLWVHRPPRQMLQPETKKCFPVPTNPIRKTNETRNQRREIKRIMNHVPKINQLTEDSGFDGQNEYENEYEDHEPLIYTNHVLPPTTQQLRNDSIS